MDSSALVKLIREEAESAEIVTWLNDRVGHEMVSSRLAEVEVVRALRRESPLALGNVPSVMARLAWIEISTEVRNVAASIDHPLLRTLDAIHVATAKVAAAEDDPLHAFVTYDRRLFEVAAGFGLNPVCPGQRP